ncbi:MAG: hydrolase [Pedosphaera sp.]|nr:hydrolase [Pedosphaera sp.]
MTSTPAEDKLVFDTKWFQVAARPFAGSSEPLYVINTTDFVSIIATTTDGKMILVRQFRPAVSRKSLELPSGHVEKGETPEEAARKELLEETGYVADKFEFLATASPAIGRFTNKMWTYFVPNARPTDDPKYQVEAGVELVLFNGSVRSLMLDEEFFSTVSHSALFAALAHGRVNLDKA